MSKKKGHGRQRQAAGGSEHGSAPAPRLIAVPGSSSISRSAPPEPSARLAAPPLAAPFKAQASGRTVQDARRLMDQRRWAEARNILAPLARTGPNADIVLEMLAEVYYELREMAAYADVCEQLSRLRPDDPETAGALTLAYGLCEQPALAVQAGRRYLARWPQHRLANEVRKLLALLDKELPNILAQGHLEGEEGLETFAIHEQALIRLSNNKLGEVRELEERVLRRKPGFIPALNTISQSYALEGRLDRAIEYSRRVLEHDPQNFHALGNLTRDLCLLGRLDEARAMAERLKPLQSDNPDAWAKQVEALSFLSDDQGIMDVYAQAERGGQAAVGMARPVSLHLVAVAAWRLGREQEARKLWQTALKLMPGLDLARDNLEDLRQPVGERHAPWPYTLSYWLNPRTLDDLRVTMESTPDANDEAAARSIRRFVRQHPEVETLVPLLLDHGDPVGREFALRLAQATRSPQMLSALHDFALGQRGPDAMRSEAAAAASEAGLMPTGPTRMWMQGEWHEVLMLGFEISDEPTDGDHSREVAELLSEGTIALQDGDALRAEEILQQALALEPDAPDIQNNLAAAYQMQGRRQESAALSARIFEEHPDYFFGRINMAQRATRQRDFERAKSLLEPLMIQRHLHTSEFRALAGAQMELSLAQGETDAARSWLKIWERVDPDDPALQTWELRLATVELPKMLERLTSRQRRRKGSAPREKSK